jgi:hypothetical protein
MEAENPRTTDLNPSRQRCHETVNDLQQPFRQPSRETSHDKLVLLTDMSLYLGQGTLDALLSAGAGTVKYVRDYPDLGDADISGDYRFTYHAKVCDGFADPCLDQPASGRISNCTGSQCSYTNLDGGFGTVTLFRTGKVWRATGVLRTNAENATTCYGQPRPTPYEFTVTVLSGKFVNNIWTAATVQIDEHDTAEAISADCPSVRYWVTATADRSR